MFLFFFFWGGGGGGGAGGIYFPMIQLGEIYRDARYSFVGKKYEQNPHVFFQFPGIMMLKLLKIYFNAYRIKNQKKKS